MGMRLFVLCLRVVSCERRPLASGHTARHTEVRMGKMKDGCQMPMRVLLNTVTWVATAAVNGAAGCAVAALLWVGVPVAHAEDKPVYRCPGNLYTDAMTAREARDKGCKTLDGAPITVIQSPVPRTSAGPRPAAPASQGDRVGTEDQKARDSDARRILEAELRKEEDALAALRKDFNDGQPERRGDERNYQKYLDRVTEMKAAITRKESDVASLKRELGKFGASR